MAKRVALTSGARYNYSPIEQKLFSLLSEKEKITSTFLAKECFGKELYARNNAVTRMRLLSEKVRLNEEPFRIASGAATQRGPRPKEYWIERV